MRCAYTVITDSRYSLASIKQQPGWDYLCFASVKIRSSEWNIVRIAPGALSPKKLSRRVKILFDEYVGNYDASLYVDSKFHLRDITGVMNRYLKSDIAVMSHPKRSCIYDEGKELIKLGLDDKAVINAQMAKYQRASFPGKAGLFAPGIMFRKHTDLLKVCMRDWFSDVNEFSYRDILSLPVALKKHGIVPSVMPWNNVVPYFMKRANTF